MSKKQERPDNEPVLSENDLMLLEEGVRPKASKDEIESAKKTLEKKTDFTLTKKADLQVLVTASKKGRKRGPRPAASTNVTDDEERQRLETIRQIIGGQAEGLKKENLLRTVRDLLRLFRARCENGIFLQRDERATLRRFLQEPFAEAEVLEAKLANGELALAHGWTESPRPGEIRIWLEEFLETCWSNAIKQTWQMFVDELPLGVVSPAASEAVSEKDLYDHIKIVLDLKADAGTSNNSLQNPAEESEDETIEAVLDDSAPNKRDYDFYRKRSVPETLLAACSALSMFRRIVDECWFCRMDQDGENLYLLVHALCLSNPAGSLPEIVEKLDSLFMTSISRQRKHPFPPLTKEEADFGSADIPEDGQISAF